MQLNVSENNIAMGLDILQNMEMLAEIDIRNNPLTFYSDLTNEIETILPRIDMFNGKRIKEEGEFFRREADQISKVLQS